MTTARISPGSSEHVLTEWLVAAVVAIVPARIAAVAVLCKKNNGSELK